MGDKNIKNKTLESGIRDAACSIRGAMVTPEYEGRKRPQGPHQTVCAANHPPVRKPAEIDGGSGAGQTVAPLGNIRLSELPGSPSRTEQSRVHRQMRRLAAGTGGIRVLAGTPRRSLREPEESAYWLELLVDGEIVPAAKLQPLGAECDELTAIFVTIIKRARESA